MSQSLIEQFRAEDAANGYTPGQNVRPALEVAASTSADQQARSMQLAEELGLSREVVSEQREWAEQEAAARRIERNPMFARWAELSETNAAFARDDTEKMGDVFEMLFDAERSAHAESGAQAGANIVRGVLQYNARRGDKEAQARLQREDGWTEEEIQNGVIRQTPMPGTLVQLGESYKEGWQGAAKSVAGFFAMLGENMGKAVHTWQGQDMAPVWDSLAKSARDALEYADTAHSAPLNAQGWLNDAARNFYQVPLAVTTIGLAGPAALTGIMGTQIAGGTYADLTQKHEVRMPTAAELEEGARMLASAASQGWQGAVNNARMASHEAGGEGGDLYTGNEPDELAMASARARMIAAAILNTEQATPAGAAALLSLGNAAVQAPLEAVGLGKIVDAFKTTGLVNMARRIAEAIGTDLVTETIQQHPDEFARIWGKGIAKGEGFQDVWKQYTRQFWDITKRGLYAGTLSIPFAVLGGIGKAATDVRMAREAVDWAQAHVAFHAKVEETKAKKVAPRLVQQALEEGGMRDIAHVDGEALYQLVQEDPLVLQQLGLEEKAVQQAAEAGQTITLPMSKVHAQMQQEQLAKFMAISRREPDSWTAREAEVLPETLKQTAERAAEEVATKTEQARQAEIEIRRIREEIVQAASSVPTLKAKIQAEGMSPEAYADNHLEIIVRLAKSLANESGGSIADILRDQTYEGLDYDASGKLVPVSRLRDAERMEEERARAEADRPFWELVWGRVDPESLKTDYAETYKKLRKSKRGLFMPAGRGGVPLDQIADELNERGIFTGSADDLLELLKTKERPRRGYYQEGELTAEEISEAKIKDTGNGGSIELPDGSYIYWNTNRDTIEVYDEDGIPEYEEGPEYMLIDALYVSQESRGAGLGRRLLRSALKRITATRPEFSVRLNADPIADAAVSQEDLVRFYESEGFDADYQDGMSGIAMTWDGRLRWKEGEGGSLYQMNEGVDLDREVPVVSVTPRFEGQNAKVLRKRFPTEIREEVLAAFAGGVVNPDLEVKQIGKAGAYGKLMMSSADFKEHLKFSDKDSIDGLIQLEAIAALPDLVRNASLVESYDDKKNVRQIKKMHRLQAALRVGNKDYSVKLTVKEYHDGELTVDYDSPLKVYHHRVEKEMPAGNSYEGPKGGVHKPSAGIDGYTLRELLRDVNDSEGVPFNTFYQFIGEAGAARLDEAEEASTRMDNLAIARKMEQAKKDAAAIKLATGWERGADGKWRYELDDSKVQVFPDGDRTWRQTDADYARFYELNNEYGKREFTPEEEAEYDALDERYDSFNAVRQHFQQALADGKLKLKDILGAEEVFAAYPDLAELPVRFGELPNTALGAYDGEAILLNERTFGRVGTALQLKPILMHEVQHAIQDKEGFARGGSVANMWIGEARKHTAKIYKEKRKPLTLEEYAKQAWRTDEITDEIKADYQDYLKIASSRESDRAAQEGAAREAYHRLEGEVEARNTARRMGMTYEERLASLAKDTEDVARKDQIFLNNAFGQAMAMGEGARKGVIRGETVPAEKSGGMGDVVRLFYHADLSTLLHESSHVFFLQMKRLVDSGKASERMQADYQTLCQWAGSTDGYLNTDQHERLARAMELYLREGKAPSKKLESAFARFRRWLSDIYKTVAGNPYFSVDGKQVELNPDVRRVFSRILATQEEVEAQAADDAMGGDWSTRLDRLGMTGAQRIAISGLIQDAKNRAEDELHRLREADKRDRMAKWRKECAQQIEGERVYQARTALRSRKGYGLNMRALANVVGNERALEFFKRLPGVKREGASPWAFAADFGYDSVEEFVNEVMAAPTKTERMAELMAAKEQEYDRQFRSDTLLAAEEIAKAQEMIHEHLIKMTGRKERGVPLEEMRRAARDIMATLPIEEATSVGKFRYQAKRLMQAQHEAFMRRDFGKALDITFKLRLNLELTVQAQQNKKEFDALTKDMVRFTGSKEPNPVVRYAVARLAMKYGMLAPTKMIMRTEGDKDLKVVQGWIEAAQAQGYPVEFDAELWTAQLPTWRQMNSATFRRLYSQLVSMMTVERQMRHVDVQGKRMALDQYSQALGQHMLDNDPNRQNLGFADDKSLVQATKEFLDPLSTVNARLKMFDNFKPLGMAWRSIMEPINKAEAKRILFFRKYGPMLQELMEKHYDAKRLVTMKDRKQIPGLKEAVNHEMCIMVGLNMGNAGNRLRLMNGFKNTDTMQDYGEAEVNAMLEQLDENDWRFIQAVWDFFEQFKKESFDMEERLIGVRPLEVEPTPVRTKYGTLRGGYFPIAYDPRRGAKAANQQVGGGKNVMMPSVFHGMMKDRGDQGLGTPLDLRFSVITDKLAETGHNLAYREPVIEVAKLLRSHAVSRAIAATEGPVVELKFWKWLSALAGEKPTRNSLDKIASLATSRMAIYSMGFKVTTMFAQATGLLATSTQIGWKWTGRGVRDTFNGGNLEKVKEMWQDVCARSPMMQDRMKSFDRDVYTMSHRLFETGHKNAALNLLKKTESWLTEHAFTATGFIQLWMVDIPTWRGAFAKGMEELNMTEEEAALYADDMVVTAQGSGATKDLSDIMREKGFMRLMTMFYSYFNAMYNMFLMQTSKTLRHPKEEWPYLASMAFVLWFVEPVVTGLITGRGPEEDEEWYEWALMNGVKQPFQMIPVLRDLSGAYFNHIEGKFGSDYRFTPAADVIGAFEKTLEHGADLFTSDDYEGRKKAAKRLARDIGMISGTPLLSSQALTTLGNMYDWLDGTEEFALRDLFFTRKK